MIKRNDLWAICLGALQIILFSKLLTIIPANVLTPSLKAPSMPPNAFNTVIQQTTVQPLHIFRFIMMLVALFFLFKNISTVSQIVSAKEEVISSKVGQVINVSALILISILIVTLFQGY